MDLLRRDFLKFCVGSAAALGLELSAFGTMEKALAAGAGPRAPSYPIATHVYTTIDKTIISKPHDAKKLLPGEVSEYASYHYGEWQNGPGQPYIRPEMKVGGGAQLSIRDPSAATLLSFFTISDIHIADKESPAQANYLGYYYPEVKTPPTGTPPNVPLGNSSAYSAIILYTTQVLDAAIQTINALHKKTPFDFGISLGDAANNTQYNELRWYIDVIDGKMIHPSSGAHKGARTIDYQKPYQAAGLDKSILWYQVIGNHDQFWMGSAKVNAYIQETYVGPNILSLGEITTASPDFESLFGGGYYYMGAIDGSTKYGTLIGAGQIEEPPPVAADPNRRSLSVGEWMGEFFNTTTKPVGHGFTQEMIDQEFACYSFYPKSDIPIKVIVLDDTDKVGCGAAAALDHQRYHWLIQELDAGEAAGELMVICAHVPIRPYANYPPPANNPYYPLWSLWDPYADPKITEDDVLAKLHTYKNLVLWCAGHVHRNAITPQPSPDGNPEHDFWEVETASLRDFPRNLRRIEIVRNSDNNISIFALDVDVAANPDPLPDGSLSPAMTSRSYSIATQQIFKNRVKQGPHINPHSGVYNAELVKQLSPKMRAKLADLAPVVSSFKINDGAASTVNRIVTLNNTVAGTTPTHYKAGESSSFRGAGWQPYSNAPTFTLSPTDGSGGKTVYFMVKDASGKQSAVVKDSIRG
ncbi:MAG: TIGR03768 family metallophosphoesterase [Syntrophobacteraceae bacterium]